MIFTQIANFSNEFQFFQENFYTTNDYLIFLNYDFFFYLENLSNYNFLTFTNNSNLQTKSLIAFIDQIEDTNLYNNLENITSVYHYSIPNVKLAYPEPFIASPSFIHTDLWFVHILVYQYWLWFIFIFLIVFFFTTFLCTLRWCNMRTRPRRETRGVSRSKCGDLITATVPVTWATSIIVNESTDAIDYYDGFGTTELVVGVRAYQWGWEYYYPKDIDLNYNIKPSYSSFIGNSLKYNKTSDTTLKTNNLWKYYQNKTTDQVITPAHILTLPIDNFKLLNFFNFNDIGSSPVQEINAFKKIRMFSKIYTTNLTFIPNSYSSKYKTFSNLFTNESIFSDSYLYGLKRQQNFLTSNAILNNQKTFLNLNSVNKLNSFNFKNNVNTSFNNNFKNSSFKQYTNSNLTSFVININNFFLKYYFNNNLNIFSNSILYSNFISNINNDSDRYKINYPLYKMFNLKLKNNNFENFKNLNKLNNFNDLTTLDLNTELKSLFSNDFNNFKITSAFSSNQSISVTNRYIKNFSSNSSSLTNYNHSLDLNTLNNYISTNNQNLGLNNNFFYNSFNTNWSSLISSNKYLSAKPNLDYPYSPVISNNPYINVLNYDNLKNTNITEVPTILQGKEELMPNFLNNIYWNFYWSNSNNNLKFNNNFSYNNIHQSFYLPMFSFYYDYDFRNWQSLELLEDSYWESIYSIYTHDEYLNISKNFYEHEYNNKFNTYYNQFNKKIHFKDNKCNTSFFKNTLIGDFYSNTLYLDDFVNPVNLISTKNFSLFPLLSSLNNLDDSYESLKYVNYFFNNNNKILLNSSIINFNPYSFISVFDSFRVDYEDFSWFTDENNLIKFSSDRFNLNSIYKLNLFNNNFSNFIFNENLVNDKLIRFNNSLNLRNPVKNSMVTYNAIQKVFRTRFDESRSNTKLSDFSNFYTKQPYIGSSRIPYEKLLGKTKENFFKINFYKNSFQKYFNNFYDLNSSLNFYFYDFPFLLALKSDGSRYLWFDWFAKWGFYEVQPSSSSRYAIYGMPYFSKNFEFNTAGNEALNESETYLLRLSKARRNYLSNWTYTPYFYIKNNSWYKNNIIYDLFNQKLNNISRTWNILNLMNWYWTDLYFISSHNFLFSPSNSNNSSYLKLTWKPQNSIQSYYYNINNLIDILTKREYLYREFFNNNNKIINLPNYLTNNASNPLINEIKASFLFIDPINNNNEYSRDVYFNSLNFFNFIIIKSFLSKYENFLNLSILTDYLFYYFLNTNLTNNLYNNSELLKNQYRPMRKGVTNMIRLHATGAIAMPIEIRLQVLASSKDVIHSWAIPSAGIKIDCVPGYSSHKVMIFLVSGIFWGQCMEICGRYHHWMPIIVYFMKRDLFFLWCTHFVFLSGSNNMWNINDRQYTNYVKTISFDKFSWLTELNN